MPAKKKRAVTAPSRSAKKPTAKKKAAAKKPAAQKPAAKKAAAKKTVAKKKAVAKKPAAKKPAAKKAAPKKQGGAKKAIVNKASARKPEAPGAVAALTVAAAPPPPRPALPPDPTEELAQVLAALALSKKADDVVILRVTELTSYADYFVLASAPSERQVQAIARHVAEEMKKVGKGPFGSEGLEQGHWVLVDYGAVVLHVFLGSARQYYDLEGFWSDAPRVDVDEARGTRILDERLTEAAALDAETDESPPLAVNE